MHHLALPCHRAYSFPMSHPLYSHLHALPSLFPHPFVSPPLPYSTPLPLHPSFHPPPPNPPSTHPRRGAATGPTVLHFFEDIGIPICEGYGLTETSPIISVGANGWTTRRLGCVGTPLDNVIVQIVDPGSDTHQELPADMDGEICVAGPSVMTGGCRGGVGVSSSTCDIQSCMSCMDSLTHLFLLLFSVLLLTTVAQQGIATTPQPTTRSSSGKTAKGRSPVPLSADRLQPPALAQMCHSMRSLTLCAALHRLPPRFHSSPHDSLLHGVSLCACVFLQVFPHWRFGAYGGG